MYQPLSLPPRRSRSRQMTFEGWDDHPIRHYRQATYIVGDFFEELTAEIFSADRFRVKSGCVCPDAVRGGLYFESKAMKEKGGHTVLYQPRLDRYTALMRETDGRLLYVFWIHGAVIKECRTKYALLKSLSQNVVHGYVIEWMHVHTYSRTHLRLETSSALPDFYRFKPSDLRCLRPSQAIHLEPQTVYGRRTDDVHMTLAGETIWPKLFLRGEYER